MNDYKTVTIPACAEHEGRYTTTANLKWKCPVCGGPRGEVRKVRSYDGSLYMDCDGWENPCGHIDKYSDVRKEAAQRKEGQDKPSCHTCGHDCAGIEDGPCSHYTPAAQDTTTL